MDTDAVTIIGAGGIGLAVGGAWLASGIAVRFIERDLRKVERGRQAGLAFVPFDDWTPSPAGFHLLCVKCYDNAAVLAKLPPDATILPIQNGFDPQLDAFRHDLEGIASFVAAAGPGSIESHITRRGALHIGPHGQRPMTAAAKRLIDQLGATRSRRFPLVIVANILPFKYTKLMYNSAISPLAAAAGLDNGELLGDPHARKLFFALIRENYAILSAAGIELGKVGPFHPRTVAKILRRKWLARLMARAFEPSLRGTYCSMAGEIEKGRTEIDNYNGHLLRLAEGRVAAPLNRAVYDLVKRMERERAKPDRGILQLLAKSL